MVAIFVLAIRVLEEVGTTGGQIAAIHGRLALIIVLNIAIIHVLNTANHVVIVQQLLVATTDASAQAHLSHSSFSLFVDLLNLHNQNTKRMGQTTKYGCCTNKRSGKTPLLHQSSLTFVFMSS